MCVGSWTEKKIHYPGVRHQRQSRVSISYVLCFISFDHFILSPFYFIFISFGIHLVRLCKKRVLL